MQDRATILFGIAIADGFILQGEGRGDDPIGISAKTCLVYQ